MEQEAFYKKINELYNEIENNSNGNPSNPKKALVEFLILNNKKWAKYPVQVIETLDKCLSSYDPNKGEFSNMLTFILHQKVDIIKKKETSDEFERQINETPLERNNDEGDTYLITDVESPADKHLSGIQKILTIDEIREDFSKIDNALKNEKENLREKARLATREILYILKKQGYELLNDSRVFELGKSFDFSNNDIWQKYFYNIDDLPTQEVLAASMSIKKSNATKMMSRFYERLRNSVEKIATV